MPWADAVIAANVCRVLNGLGNARVSNDHLLNLLNAIEAPCAGQRADGSDTMHAAFMRDGLPQRVTFAHAELAVHSTTMQYAVVVSSDASMYVAFHPLAGAWKSLSTVSGAGLTNTGLGSAHAPLHELSTVADAAAIVATATALRATRVVFCGVSLGGAVAQLACVSLRCHLAASGGEMGQLEAGTTPELLVQNIHCVAFGAPLWADKKMAYELNVRQWGSALLNVYHPCDPVPAIVRAQHVAATYCHLYPAAEPPTIHSIGPALALAVEEKVSNKDACDPSSPPNS